MHDIANIELAKHRLLNAYEDYLSAIDLIKDGHYKVANNRAYYSIFHSMRAILALESVDFKKHSGVIAYFNLNYIKSGKFDKKFYKIITDASYIRNESDYSDFYVASKDEAEIQVNGAIEFYTAIKDYMGNVF